MDRQQKNRLHQKQRETMANKEYNKYLDMYIYYITKSTTHAIVDKEIILRFAQLFKSELMDMIEQLYNLNKNNK